MKVYFEAPETWAWMQVVGMLAAAGIVFLIARFTEKGTRHE